MRPKSTTRPTPPTTHSPTRAEDLMRALEATRVEAERTKAQLQAMQALTDTALSHLALDDLLHELLGRVTAVMGVDNVAILLLDEGGQTLTMRAAHGLLEEEVGGVRVPVGQGFAGRIAASRAPLIVDDTSAFDLYGVYPLLRQQLCSVVGVPLLAEDLGDGQLVSRLVGVVHVGSAAPRRFTEADVQLLQRAADRIALAIDHTRLYAAEQNARQRAEAALARAVVSEAQAAERAERLNTILDTMADAVAVYDAAGRPVQINRAYREMYALEYAPAGFETMTTFERVRSLKVRTATGAPISYEDIPVARALLGEVVTGPGADLCMRTFDGRELEVSNSAAPLRDGEGRVVGVVVLVRDMTERNRLERERAAARADELAAREASRRMEAFLATAAHDLRSPLTATIGYIELAKRASAQLAVRAHEADSALAQQVAAVRRRLEDADHSTKRLTRLLSLLFDTAAIRAGKLELHREPCDLVALVYEQVAALRMAAPNRTIRLPLPARVEPILVEADADRIGQVVTNYVTNALKYSPADRPVDIAVAARGGRVRVTVCDQGPGIPKEERARVWELFHRASGVTAQDGAQGGSLGLGLHICKAIIAAHGGRVGVESAEGQGSTFWFTLPLAPISR